MVKKIHIGLGALLLAVPLFIAACGNDAGNMGAVCDSIDFPIGLAALTRPLPQVDDSVSEGSLERVHPACVRIVQIESAVLDSHDLKDVVRVPLYSVRSRGVPCQVGGESALGRIPCLVEMMNFPCLPVQRHPLRGPEYLRDVGRPRYGGDHRRMNDCLH